MMRETHKDGYKSGSMWVTCPRCGFEYRKEEMVTEHTGKEVCKPCNDDIPETLSRRFK